MIPSYAEIMQAGHKGVSSMWGEPIEIQEKVDGSQISFMLDKETGELCMRSKGQQLFEDAPSSGMFKEGIEAIKERADLLVPGHIWRGEYLRTPKHNSLAYDRIPQGHIVIFDIELSLGEFATSVQREEMASFLGLEVVPTLFQGTWGMDLPDLKKFLETPSFLGGQLVEGIVAKCYTQFYNGKPMMAKLVSEAFKEVHDKEWKKSNPTKKDVVETLIDQYRTEARWRKAVQHMRERGEITDSPRDIGPLLKEVSADILKEEEEAIKDALFKLTWPQISRGVCRGFPDWYKNELLEGDG